jgi:competence protein ComEC
MVTCLRGYHDFWHDHPALLYGLALWIGYSASIAPGWYILVLLLALWTPLPLALYKRHTTLIFRLMLALLTACTAYLHGYITSPLPKLPTTGIQGEGTLTFHSAELHNGAHNKVWLYHGTLHHLTTAHLPPLPLTLSLPAKDPLPKESPFNLNTRWLIEGTLKQKESKFFFYSKAHTPWKAVDYHYNGIIASWRQKARSYLAHYIHSVVDEKRSAPFLYGMITGIFDDATMRYHFNRFGIQHLLAISGFHFALVSACLSFILRLCLPRQYMLYTLLLLLAVYCIFLGSSPSILRAWISLSLGITAYLCQKVPRALNLMGIALIAVLLTEPLYLLHAGFQFSFLITAAILLLTKPIDHSLHWLIATRPLSQVVSWHASCQLAYVSAVLTRQALALGIAVNVAALPLTLYHFHSFPWLSLFYNLFFPPLVAGAIVIFIIATFMHFILSPLGIVLHGINSIYIHYLVGMAVDAPPAFNWAWQGDLSTFALVFYLTILSYTGAYFYLQHYRIHHDEHSFSIVPQLL